MTSLFSSGMIALRAPGQAPQLSDRLEAFRPNEVMKETHAPKLRRKNGEDGSKKARIRTVYLHLYSGLTVSTKF
ncbi:hypothetical protein K443DRAFT_678142 [Laccaria amethystina LaAM-08-1]|uniref:Uncharacterized protein n=1 Tax=Laccaria amethystina LaAM-08-1 TaxID=1095629 RepID=A0A0C9WSC9_9AGAR|nr:hypothetical protein K443DRAFT_678142 [Laccaria amethystina LaAM-08-1]